jgi:hypothetical protein
MAKYRFQFKTGNVCDGHIELKVTDFIGEIEDEKMNPSLALTIEAHGGQLVTEKPKARSKAKKAGEK